jgi:phosphoribosylformylglycinamidine synthase
MAMDAHTGEVAGASADRRPDYREGPGRGHHSPAMLGSTAIADCGAGGSSSAVGDTARSARHRPAQVRLKYAGLAPWEIWLSEAQERMVLAVAASAVPDLQALCDVFAVELTDIGVFTGGDRLRVQSGARPVLDLTNAFLHGGIPQRRLSAVLPSANAAAPLPSPVVDYGDVLLRLLAHPNIASKADTIRSYDHEVQGGTVVKPLTGALNDGPSDASVSRPTAPPACGHRPFNRPES